MPRYANVDKLMKHSIRMDWSILRWVNEVDICTAINPNVVERKKGKWVNDRGIYRCSSCNQLWSEWWVGAKPIERMKKECPYCPLCGSYNGEAIEENEE